MSQTIEQEYDRILKEIGSKMPKVETGLVMQTMYYERRFSDVEPQVELKLHYKQGVDLDQKRTTLAKKYGFLLAKEPHNTLRATGLMTLLTISEISEDNDIAEVNGMATCASY